jgi:hypothetical protein
MAKKNKMYDLEEEIIMARLRDYNAGITNGCVQKIMMEAKRCIPADKAISRSLVFVSYETFQDAVHTAVAKAIRDSR